MEAHEYKALAQKKCERLGVQLILADSEKVLCPPLDIPVNGYFDAQLGRQPVLACACGKPEEEWLPILVHEDSHLDQWIEDKDLWNSQFVGGKNYDDIMDEWLSGKNFPEKEYTHAIRVMQNLEIDCEKRTVRKIGNLNLPMSVISYTKSANAYLWFYSVMLIERKWYTKPPYQIPQILDIMPIVFLDDYTIVPRNYIELCRKYVF